MSILGNLMGGAKNSDYVKSSEMIGISDFTSTSTAVVANKWNPIAYLKISAKQLKMWGGYDATGLMSGQPSKIELYDTTGAVLSGSYGLAFANPQLNQIINTIEDSSSRFSASDSDRQTAKLIPELPSSQREEDEYLVVQYKGASSVTINFTHTDSVISLPTTTLTKRMKF